MEIIKSHISRGSYNTIYNRINYNILVDDDVFKIGNTMRLVKHGIIAFEFKIINIQDVNISSLEITLEVEMTENNEVPIEVFIVYEQDEEFDHSWKFRDRKSTLDEAKEELKKYKNGQIVHANMYDIYTTIVFENKRGK